MRTLVLTAMVGSKVDIPTCYHEDQCDYILVTDQYVEDSSWKIDRPLMFSDDTKYSNRRVCRFYKTMMDIIYPGYDLYVWHDISSYVKADVKELYSLLGQNDYAFFKHRERNCLYEEALACIHRDLPELVLSQVQYYTDKGMPKNWGLLETTSYIKRSTQKSREVAVAWNNQICKFSSRDQLSIPYVLWSKDVKYSILPGYAQFRLHDKSSNNLIPSKNFTMHTKGKSL